MTKQEIVDIIKLSMESYDAVTLRKLGKQLLAQQGLSNRDLAIAHAAFMSNFEALRSLFGGGEQAVKARGYDLACYVVTPGLW